MIGCFDTTIPIGWRLRWLREKSYAMFFACDLRNVLAFIAFLSHFLFCLRIFSLRKTLRAFEWKPGLRLG